MLRMVSHPHRPLSGHIMCYLIRTYHVLPTPFNHAVDIPARREQAWHYTLIWDLAFAAKAPWRRFVRGAIGPPHPGCAPGEGLAFLLRPPLLPACFLGCTYTSDCRP